MEWVGTLYPSRTPRMLRVECLVVATNLSSVGTDRVPALNSAKCSCMDRASKCNNVFFWDEDEGLRLENNVKIIFIYTTLFETREWPTFVGATTVLMTLLPT